MIGVLVVVVFVLLVVFIIVALVMAAIAAGKRELERMRRLHAYAAALGWRAFGVHAPPTVATFSQNRRTRWALFREQAGRDVWFVWHQWTERTQSGNTTHETTHNLTRYFLWLGPVYPDVQVMPRTAIGAFFRPVRGIGTGDADFDRNFVVKPSGHPAPLAVMNPMIRRAMLEQRLPSWEIRAGTLTVSYRDRPTEQNLQDRADRLVWLASLLN